MNDLLGELYKAADPRTVTYSGPPTWFKMQELAFSDDPKDNDALSRMILTAEAASIRLPIIRRARNTCRFTTKKGEVWGAMEGETLILDIVSPLSSD